MKTSCDPAKRDMTLAEGGLDFEGASLVIDGPSAQKFVIKAEKGGGTKYAFEPID